MTETYYFDHAATTYVDDQTLKIAAQAMQSIYGNPSSLHDLGLRAENLITAARSNIAAVLKCKNNEIYFTSGATESNNLAILGLIKQKGKHKKKIITTAVEHSSVREPLLFLEKQGFGVHQVFPRKDGVFYTEDFLNAIDDQTILASFMWVNNETGYRLPVEEIAEKIKRRSPETYIHVDGVQGFCKLPSVSLKNIDFFTFSGHKIYAPKGVGGIYIKKGITISPLFYGGKQENNIRSGTENVPGIAALGYAVSSAYLRQQQEYQKYVQLHDALLKELQAIPQIVLNSDKNTVPYIINFAVKNVRSEILLHFLESKNIYVSSGSACSKGNLSNVLLSFHVPRSLAECSIRLSFGKNNQIHQIDYFIKNLKEGIKRYANSYTDKRR